VINEGRSNRVDYSTGRDRREILFVFWAIWYSYRSSGFVVTCPYDYLRSEQATRVTCEPMSGALVQRQGHMIKRYIRGSVVSQLQQIMQWHNCPPAGAHHQVSWRTGCRMKCAWAHNLPQEGCQNMHPMQSGGCHMEEPYISQHRPLTALRAGTTHTPDPARSFDSWKLIDQAL
jgi:hypothetical protein